MSEKARTGWFQLTVVGVPDRLGGLMERIGFRLSASGKCWYRNFNAAIDSSRPKAQYAVEQLRRAGLRGRWRQIEAPKQRSRFKGGKPTSKADRSGFGGALNAKPIAGSWRRKRRRV